MSSGSLVQNGWVYKMKATAELSLGAWYLRTAYGVFEMPNEIQARKISNIINAAYEQGKRDKVLELRESLYIYDEIYDD